MHYEQYEAALEAAYWNFDARRSGINEWKHRPQSERDAFKNSLRALLPPAGLVNVVVCEVNPLLSNVCEYGTRSCSTAHRGRGQKPLAYACPVGCGCLWRDNEDGTMSLFNGDQKSCNVCEVLPLTSLQPRITLSTPGISGFEIEDCCDEDD